MSETREIVSVITCDLEGRIETFNPNAEKLFGYTAEEVVGKKRVSPTDNTSASKSMFSRCISATVSPKELAME